MIRYPQFWASLFMLLLAALVLHRRGDRDFVPESTPLAYFPRSIDSRVAVDFPLSSESLELLGKGIFLNRVYVPLGTSSTSVTVSSTPPGSVGLFVGYFPTQRSGQSIHSPQNCLPGSGWTFDKSGVTSITMPDGKIHEVGEYLISNGGQKDEVLYWYQSRGETIANDYKAKFTMLWNSIRTNRTDAALVRIIVPLEADQDQQQGHEKAVAFARGVLTHLPLFLPN